MATTERLPKIREALHFLDRNPAIVRQDTSRAMKKISPRRFHSSLLRSRHGMTSNKSQAPGRRHFMRQRFHTSHIRHQSTRRQQIHNLFRQ